MMLLYLLTVQTESIGTVRLNQAAVPADEDEFMSSDEGEETEDEYYQQGSASPIESPPDHFLPPTPTSTDPHPKLTVEPPPTTLSVPKALKSPRFPKFPRMLPSRQNSLDSTQSSTSGTLPASSASTTSMPASANTKKKFRRSWVQTRKKSDYNFDPGNDILGIVLLEIKGAEDLPKLKNSMLRSIMMLTCLSFVDKLLSYSNAYWVGHGPVYSYFFW